MGELDFSGVAQGGVGPQHITVGILFLIVVGTYFNIPPMSTLVEFSGAIKADAAIKYGTPPYGRAELSSLKGFAQKERLDLKQSIT